MKKYVTLLILVLMCVLSQAQTHVVQKKETLYSISKEYGLSVEELKLLNGLKLDRITPGQELKVSKETLHEERVDDFIETTRKSSGNIIHTVKSGECLFGIARLYTTPNQKVSVPDIMKWNNLKKDQIVPGQKLEIRLRQKTDTETESEEKAKKLIRVYKLEDFSSNDKFEVRVPITKDFDYRFVAIAMLNTDPFYIWDVSEDETEIVILTLSEACVNACVNELERQALALGANFAIQ